MSSGTQISDMTLVAVADVPEEAIFPFVVSEAAGGLVPSANYVTDVIAAILARPTFAELAASDGSSLVGFLQSGTGAVSTTVQTEIRLDGLRPEQFGAVGNGVANDAPALIKAITQQQASGVPVTLTPGATYGLGTAAWVGIAATLTRPLEIYGNGATIKLLVVPSQTAVAGSVNPFFKIDGGTDDHPWLLRNINVDFNDILEPCFNAYRCTVDWRGCYGFNGDMGAGGAGNASILFYCLDSGGTIAGNRSYEVGYFGYLGHTDVGMACDNMRVFDNTAEKCWKSDTATRGDAIVGVMTNSQIYDNRFSGVFSGIAVAGYAANSTVSSDVDIHDNEISDYLAQGIQTDIIGTIKAKRLKVHHNTITGGNSSGAAIYLVQAEDSSADYNSGKDCFDGVLVDKTGGKVGVSGNQFDAGIFTTGAGVRAGGQLGTITDVAISANQMTGFAANFVVGGAGNAVSNVSVVGGNVSRGGAKGLALADTCTAIFVDGNDFAGGHTTDIDNALTNGPVGVQFGQNKFATATGVAPVLQLAAPAPTAKTADATLTAAELLSGIVTATSSSAVALTFPTGANTDAALGAFAIGQSFDWYVINLGSASGAVTLTANTNHTFVGNATLAINTECHLRTRKTAASTFITYRIG